MDFPSDNALSVSPINNNHILIQGKEGLLIINENWEFTSVPQTVQTEQTTLYPNPTDSKVNIEFNLSEFSHVSINILDIEGKVLENLYNGKLNSGKHSFYWDCSEYLSGTYYCRIEAENFQKTLKVLIYK